MPRWTQGANIGSGRFGVVYACADTQADPDAEVYAVKFLQTDYLQIPEALQRFEREVTILSDLHHENLMPVVDRGATNQGRPWFVMPRAERSIKDAIADYGGPAAIFGLDESWTIRIFRGVLAGVAHAHSHNVLHRDLKPSNILLRNDQPLVSDFGIAKQIDVDGTTLTRTAQELGTLRYMAPEQSSNARRADKAADVYSLGKILGYMLTGIEPEPLVVNVDPVPERFRWFVEKCCRDDPAERFADASVALTRFERILQAPTVVLPPLENVKALIDTATTQLDQPGEAEAIEALDAELRAQAETEVVYRRMIPRLPKALIRRWAQTQPNGLRQVMRTYDGHIDRNGDLPFDYCDTVADFLAGIFPLTGDLTIKRLIIVRLLEVGRSHSRFHVGDVTVELLCSLSAAPDVAVAEEAIDDHQEAAAWIAEQAMQRPIRSTIAEALRRAFSDGGEAASF